MEKSIHNTQPSDEIRRLSLAYNVNVKCEAKKKESANDRLCLLHTYIYRRHCRRRRRLTHHQTHFCTDIIHI